MTERKERAEKLAAERREREMAMKAKKRANNAALSIPDISCPDYPSWLLDKLDKK